MKDKLERYGVQIPRIVRRARKLAEDMNFPLMPEGRPIGFTGTASACIPEVGHLQRTLS